MVSLRDDEGKICHDDSLQMQIIQEYQRQELRMADEPFIEIGGPMDEIPCQDEIDPSTVRACLRKPHPSKSSPEWSNPLRAWLIAENEVVEGLSKLFNKIGEQRQVVRIWKQLKQVWIAKP